jgi:CrcB protein
MTGWMWVMLGSAIGGAGRFWLTGLVDRLAGAGFPWGTVTVNVAGSFVIGLAAAATDRDALPPEARLLVMPGLCGGFTTFSAFSLQTTGMLRDGLWALALGHALLAVTACVVATFAGYRIAQ